MKTMIRNWPLSVLAALALAASPLVMAQGTLSRSPYNSSGIPENPQGEPEGPAAAYSITQNSSQTPEELAGAACLLGLTYGLETRYLRRFLLSTDHGITDPFGVSSVDIGIEAIVAPGAGQCENNPITVNTYRIATGDNLVYANMELVETAHFDVDSATTLSVINVPMPAGGGFDPNSDDLVVEWVTCDYSTTAGTGAMFPGANDDGQSGLSYIAAPECGVFEPTDLANVGFPDSHNILTVNGDTDDNGPGDNRATFAVSKIFTDGNDEDEVTVSIDCNTGLILDQDKTLGDGESVEFVVTSFESLGLNCTITESDTSGYSATYETGIASNDVSCEYNDIIDGDAFSCTITNTPDPVDVVVHKDWVIEGPDNDFSHYYSLDLYCQASGMTGPNAHNDGGDSWHGYDSGNDDDTFVWSIIPLFPNSTCYVEEDFDVDFVEEDNGCTSLSPSVNNPVECTITNTVFFESIPTLGQYGMALLALLMLGVGFISFRRFS